MFRIILNNLLKAKGYYQVEENRIYRDLPLGFSYCCDVCNSTLEACRVAYELNSLKLKDTL